MHRRHIAILAIVAFVAGACGGTPSGDRMQTDVQRLAPLLPVLDDLDVVEYRGQDWCRILEFEGGKYGERTGDSGCFYGPPPYTEFDAAGEAAFEQIQDALGDTGLTVYWVAVSYADDGTIAEARFTFDTGFTIPFDGAHDYVYSVDQPAMREDGDTIDTRIDANWHLTVDDWN